VNEPQDMDHEHRVLPSLVVNGFPSKRIVNIVAMVFVSVLVVVAVAFGAHKYWYLQQVNPSGQADASEIFLITETDDLSTLSKRLKQGGFIVNDSVFRSYASSEGGLEILPGYYTLRPHDHMGNILRVLRTPPNETLSKVTFPEGFTLAQIACIKEFPPLMQRIFLQKPVTQR
jgi:UPF0755 protein